MVDPAILSIKSSRIIVGLVDHLILLASILRILLGLEVIKNLGIRILTFLLSVGLQDQRFVHQQRWLLYLLLGIRTFHVSKILINPA